MRILLLAAACLLFTTAALAADSDGVSYTSADYDFSLWLPDGGQLSDVETDPEWSHDDSTIFTWVADDQANSLVFLIMGSALALESGATDDDIASFVEGLTDEQNNAENEVTVADISEVFAIAGRGWVSVLFEDNSGEMPGEFEIFVTREGVHIYAVAFHYTAGKDAAGEQFVADVLSSFSADQV
jgi:hypothetical protein